jgi:hypothetical protein
MPEIEKVGGDSVDEGVLRCIQNSFYEHMLVFLCSV